MILSRDDIKSFCNLSEEELNIIDNVKRTMKLRPSGKLQIQGCALDLDEFSTQIRDILMSLQFQLSKDELSMEKLIAAYYHDKMGLFKDKELYYKFINDKSEASVLYQDLVLRTKRLKAFIDNLDGILWIIKERKSTLHLSHSTDY